MSYDIAVWEMIRASGLIAYVLLSTAVAMGLSVKLRSLDWLMKRAWAFEAHQTVSVAALVLTVFHVLMLFLNRHVPFTLSQVLIPFSANWNPLAVALGTLSLYLVVLLVASSYTRQHIGYRTWRAIHFGGFAAWAMAMGHGIFAGTDSGDIWVQYMYLLTGTVVGLLILMRVMSASSERRRIAAPAD